MGFNTSSFSNVGGTVDENIMVAVRDSSSMPRGLNETLITLITKVDNPIPVSNFRPVSLCNVLYKIITKVLAIRMQPLVKDLIGPTQGSFILGRVITDNIVIGQEIIHSMRFKKGLKSWMVLKVVLKKAYDRLWWDFLVNTLIDA
ncbi:hypothetical protein V2J09_004023 [Rumex salicifolius]